MRDLCAVKPLIGSALLFCGCLWMSAASGQAIQHKHLVIGLSGGMGITHISSNADSLNASALRSSAARFAFSYALGDRWSIGGHYDRIGSLTHPSGFKLMRATTYMIEGIYRPFNGKLAALEISAAIGLNIFVMRPQDALLPFVSKGPVFALGVRYLHMINETLGVFMCLDHAQSVKQRMAHFDQFTEVPVETMDLSWHNQRFTAGMFVRY